MCGHLFFDGTYRSFTTPKSYYLQKNESRELKNESRELSHDFRFFEDNFLFVRKLFESCSFSHFWLIFG
jgi:hypothetical protein